MTREHLFLREANFLFLFITTKVLLLILFIQPSHAQSAEELQNKLRDLQNYFEELDQYDQKMMTWLDKEIEVAFSASAPDVDMSRIGKLSNQELESLIQADLQQSMEWVKQAQETYIFLLKNDPDKRASMIKYKSEIEDQYKEQNKRNNKKEEISNRLRHYMIQKLKEETKNEN